MQQRTIAAISLTNQDFPSFQEKLEEARYWIELAAGNGAQLIVLPEALTKYKGDGPNNPNALTIEQMALENWQESCATLIDAAKEYKVAITVPVHTKEQDGFTNSFFIVSKQGEILGSYQKMFPTDGEIKKNIKPARLDQKPIGWEGIKIGGAICYDTNFPEVFENQVQNGADLFLIPSFWPGGSQLNYYALRYSAPMVLCYPAWSKIIGFDGKEVTEGGYRNETLRFGYGSPVVQATLNFDSVAMSAGGNQEKIVEIERTYGSDVHVSFDQNNCMFFLESLSHELTVEQIIARFGLTPIQEKLACSAKKSQRHREKICDANL